MNKLITVAASILFTIFFVVSNSVHASGATAPTSLVEVKEIEIPGREKPLKYCLSKPLRKDKDATVEPTLVVYFHDQGSNVQEPYTFPDRAPLALSVVLSHAKPLGLVSVPAGQNWGTDAHYADISLVITEALAVIPAREIVLMGQTMGGSMALNYAAQAPAEIKEKIIGVVCSKTVGDLKELYNETKLAKLQLSLRQALGGLPDNQGKRYKERGFFSRISDLGKNVKVGYIMSANDFVIPTDLQEELVNALRRKKIAVKVVESPSSIHPIPPKWSLALDFCLYKGLK